jgi:hypothetical protein
MNKQRTSPLVILGAILVAMGSIAAVSSPFVKDGRQFAMMLGSGFVFACGIWIAVRLIGYFSDPNRISPRAPPETDLP